MYLLSCLFPSKLKLHIFLFATNLQGTKKSLNALFSNVHRVLHDVPSSYKYTHLKHQTVVKLIKEKDYMSGKLECHLYKTEMTYAEAVQAIIDLNGENDPIPRDLGDFFLGAISQTIDHTIFIVKLTIGKQTDANRREVTVYGVYTEYLFKGDKAHSTGRNAIVLVYNGIDYFAPATPKAVVKLTSAASMASTHLNDAMRQVQGILDAIPPSDARAHLSKSLMYMGASKNIWKGQSSQPEQRRVQICRLLFLFLRLNLLRRRKPPGSALRLLL